MVVDGIRSGLDDKNIFVPDGFPCPVSGRALEERGPIVIAVSQLDVLRTTTLAHSRPSLDGLIGKMGGGEGGRKPFRYPASEFRMAVA